MCKLVMTIAGLFVAGATVSGCAAVDAGRSYLDTRGVEAVQGTLEIAEDTICRYAPVGGVIRRYGVDTEKAQAWVNLCINAGKDANALIQAIEDSDGFPASVGAPSD